MTFKWSGNGTKPHLCVMQRIRASSFKALLYNDIFFFLGQLPSRQRSRANFMRDAGVRVRGVGVGDFVQNGAFWFGFKVQISFFF